VDVFHFTDSETPSMKLSTSNSLPWKQSPKHSSELMAREEVSEGHHLMLEVRGPYVTSLELKPTIMQVFRQMTACNKRA
jgi:hypothetical protein